MATALSPIFEHNGNLHKLEIESCHIGNKSTELIASALSRRLNKSSLRRINLESNEIVDKSAKKLIEDLQMCENLEELLVGNNKIGRRACVYSPNHTLFTI